MSNGFVWFLLIVGFVIFIGISIAYKREQEQIALEQLRKLVTQAGFRIIEISKISKTEPYGTIHFVLKFKDENDVYQERFAVREINSWGTLKADFYWNEPLQAVESSMVASRLDSKEQIISDMDAEIKRLRKELDEAKKGD